MKCEICGCEKMTEVYTGPLKIEKFGATSTPKDYTVYRCENCGAMHHNGSPEDLEKFYESTDYREMMESNATVENYWSIHDVEVLDKLKITGTDIFRNKVVADIGCGGGSFLDFISGVASDIVAIEPSKEYDKSLESRGYHTYQYADQAKEWFGKVDVVVSFDVIEHVKSPEKFMADMKNLLSPEGIMIIGTPTDYPVLRKMLGDTFDRFIFQIHHPWVLSEKSMCYIADKIGVRCDEIKTIQKYGLGNLIYWLRDKKPRGHIKADFISDAVNDAYMAEMSKTGLGEYVVFKGSIINK